MNPPGSLQSSTREKKTWKPLELRISFTISGIFLVSFFRASQSSALIGCLNENCMSLWWGVLVVEVVIVGGSWAGENWSSRTQSDHVEFIILQVKS